MSVALRELFGLTRRLIAVVFGLWLAGAGCALCCATTVSAAQPSLGDTTKPRDEQQRHATAFARASCPAHAHRSTETTAAPAHARTPSKTARQSGSREVSCCEKTRQASDPARKPRPLPERSACRSPGDSFHAFAPAPSRKPLEARGRPPDLRRAHVRCCVFLI